MEEEQKRRHPFEIAAESQILLSAASLAAELGKAPIGYRIIDDAGNGHFITVEEYERLKKEVAEFERQQSLYYPPLVTASGVITSTSSEDMKHIREVLKLEPSQPAYNPAAAMAALAAMSSYDMPSLQTLMLEEAEAAMNPSEDQEPQLLKNRTQIHMNEGSVVKREIALSSE